jgi:hypothetical protein
MKFIQQQISNEIRRENALRPCPHFNNIVKRCWCMDRTQESHYLFDKIFAFNIVFNKGTVA